MAPLLLAPGSVRLQLRAPSSSRFRHTRRRGEPTKITPSRHSWEIIAPRLAYRVTIDETAPNFSDYGRVFSRRTTGGVPSPPSSRSETAGSYFFRRSSNPRPTAPQSLETLFTLSSALSLDRRLPSSPASHRRLRADPRRLRAVPHPPAVPGESLRPAAVFVPLSPAANRSRPPGPRTPSIAPGKPPGVRAGPPCL